MATNTDLDPIEDLILAIEKMCKQVGDVLRVYGHRTAGYKTRALDLIDAVEKAYEIADRIHRFAAAEHPDLVKARRVRGDGLSLSQADDQVTAVYDEIAEIKG